MDDPLPPAARYDYENCESAHAEKMLANLEALVADPATVGKTFASGKKSYKIAHADNFEYKDPIDQSVSKKQVRCWSCALLQRHDFGV